MRLCQENYWHFKFVLYSYIGPKFVSLNWSEMVSPGATEKVFAVVLQLPLLPAATPTEAVHCIEVTLPLW